MREFQSPKDQRRATLGYVAPFAFFVACLAVQRYLPGTPAAWLAVRCLLALAAMAAFSLPYLSFRAAKPFWSIAVGVAVFAVWIGPDVLWPAYRSHWILQNSATGSAVSTLPAALRSDWLFLAARVASSALLVPALEELFWRGWMMRWLVRGDFLSVPLGTCTAGSFWITAALFASEHGAYWDVGLVAGIIFNWWILRTRNLADCMLAHAVTNTCLAAWVISRGQWQYWL